MEITTDHIMAYLHSRKAMTGKMAELFILNLIDKADDEEQAEMLGISVGDYKLLSSRFEEEMRHKIRSL